MRVSECMHKAMRAAKHALANDPIPLALPPLTRREVAVGDRKHGHDDEDGRVTEEGRPRPRAAQEQRDDGVPRKRCDLHSAPGRRACAGVQ